ncbi:MAG: undecaprenyl-diphosphate phosphatase [Rhodobacteraceae bacterium]|nr:undecaprenyl-diphosphate phosphatase [Paracoccaceae bacterium]
MSIFHLLLVAVVQGLTEFLPVSSSAHLILLPSLTGLEDQGQIIDVAAHIGTLGAVILYFWFDVKRVFIGVPRLLRWQIDGPEAWLALCLVIATIPVILFGLALKLSGYTDALRSVTLIGATMIGFGLLLYWFDQKGSYEKTAERWSLKDALVMGLWQALALIPGTSRSGITITAARMLGYARTDAARLSMLMSIPTIAASGLLLGADVAISGDTGTLRDLALVIVMSFLAALLALSLMMRLLKAFSYTPYVVYRIALGGFLLWYGLAGPAAA